MHSIYRMATCTHNVPVPLLVCCCFIYIYRCKEDATPQLTPRRTVIQNAGPSGPFPTRVIRTPKFLECMMLWLSQLPLITLIIFLLETEKTPFSHAYPYVFFPAA